MRDVDDKMSWPGATSVAGPAATFSPTLGPVIAWRGDRHSQNLTLAYLTGTSGHFKGSRLEAHVSADASKWAPALYHLQGHGLVLAWVGINAARTLNVALVDLPIGTNAVVSRKRVFVNSGSLGGGGAGPPSLSPFDPLPLSVACMNDRGELCIASARHGIDFGSAGTESWAQTSQEGAALSFLYAAWRSPDDDRLHFATFPKSPLTPPTISAQSTLHRPSLAEYDNRLFVAWVGTDGDAHLNVAPVDGNAWAAGGDPIDANRVETLTELSLAAPALLSLPANAASPERLAIFWTGVDGAGTINGALVLP